MKQLNIITFLFLIIGASGVSALEVLNLLPIPAPANPTTNSSNSAPPKPSTPPESPVVVRVPGWTYRGCWSDNPLDRTLVAKRLKGYITPQQCAQYCKGCKTSPAHYFLVRADRESPETMSRYFRVSPRKDKTDLEKYIQQIISSVWNIRTSEIC